MQPVNSKNSNRVGMKRIIDYLLRLAYKYRHLHTNTYINNAIKHTDLVWHACYEQPTHTKRPVNPFKGLQAACVMPEHLLLCVL